jgi:hypothetical protein
VTSRAYLLFVGLTLVGCGGASIDLLPSDASVDTGGGADAGGDGRGDGALTTDATGDASADAAVADVVEEMCGACPCGLTDCSGTCVDTTTDPAHCGSCAGSPLLHNAFCQGSQPQCLPGLTLCNGSCFDFQSNPDHCGGCGATPCATGQKCENGVCAAGTCTPPLVGCAVTGRTACVDMTRGWPYCGSCSNVCAPTEYCAGGACHPYTSAAPCTACPCATDCARALPDAGAVACCPDFGGVSGPPLCVAGSGCTP